jgi:cell division protein FtsW
VEVARERETSYDVWLLGVTIFLLLIGTVAVLDASFARALQSKAANFDGFYYFKRQATWAVAALAGLVVVLRVPYTRFKQFWGVGLFLALGLLALVLVPHVGHKVNGAQRWFKFGPAQFQPSEFAKIALVFFLAGYSDLWRSRIKHFTRGFLPAAVAVFAVGGLVAKEDLGTSITIVATGLLMLFIMGARPAHMAVVIGAALGAAVLFIATHPERMDRIIVWLDPTKSSLTGGYQPYQGLIAVGSGGVWGQGIVRGIAKHLYLPEEYTDYIFATWAQETGLVGCLVLLTLFAVLIIRGLVVAHRTHDWFGSLLAAGLTATIGIQALMNIAVVTCLVPCTGVPLPFISYGGSSLVFTTLTVGIVLNVSRYGGDLPQARPIRESDTNRRRNRGTHLPRTQRRAASEG